MKILIAFFIILSLYLGNNFLDGIKAGISTFEEKNKIAACPTYHYLEEKLPENFEIVKTDSTSQSFNLLNKGKVDLVFSGRTLKPQDPSYDYEIIGEGYSFINKNGGIILERDLKNYTLYTDLNSVEIKEKFSVKDIFEVENIYDFIDKGIVITSWDNTDYDRSELIHFLNDLGERNYLSRRLTLYCPLECDQEIAYKIKEIYE